jgi:membrane protein
MVDIGMICPLTGGITAGLLFELAKNVFRWYVIHFADFTRVYGSLGSVIVLVIWIYYVSMILVLGAEVACVCARRKGFIAPHGG